MKTISIELIQFDNYKELLEATKGHQLTAQEIINGRSHINGNWSDFQLSSNLFNQFCNEITNVIGGQQKTKNDVFSTLLHGKPQHWGLSRMFICEHDGNFYWSYCAGQDYPYELNQIRKALK